MAVILPNSVILHIPKTAGKYVRMTLEANEIDFHQTHRNTPCDGMGQILNGLCSSHCIPRQDEEYQRRKNRLVFVRHPLTWYLSYWAFRVRFKDTPKEWLCWRKDSAFDQACGDDDFNKFIDKVLHHFPGGFLTEFYKHYTDEASAVGRMETLNRELWTFLHGFEGIKDLTFLPVKVNTSDKKGAQYTVRQAEAILEAEAEVVYRYDYNYVPDGVVG